MLESYMRKDSRKDGVIISTTGNIYEYNANSVLALYYSFIDGTPNNTVVAVSAMQLSEDVRKALIASAQKLGFGKKPIAWVWFEDDEGAKISAVDLYTIIEGLDPVSIITCDMPSTSMLSKAYSARLSTSEPNRVMGRTVISLDNFEKMLEDSDAKQRAWRLLKHL